MLAHEHPGNRANSLASVAMDRLWDFTSCLSSLPRESCSPGTFGRAWPHSWWLSVITLVLTVLGTLGIAIVLGTAILDGRWVRSFSRLPRIGPAMGSLTEAMRMYRRKSLSVTDHLPDDLPVHCMLTLGVFMVTLGLRWATNHRRRSLPTSSPIHEFNRQHDSTGRLDHARLYSRSFSTTSYHPISSPLSRLRSLLLVFPLLGVLVSRTRLLLLLRLSAGSLRSDPRGP